MLLTDKTKEDFLKYYNNHSIRFLLSWTIFEDLPLVVQNALIIEWLDSVGIIISVTYCKLSNGFDFLLYSEYYQVSSGTHTRPEATQQAILKANEIYNNLNTKENEK